MPKYERPNIERMAGYTWGEQPDDEDTVKLNTNENPYPPSPAVDEALQHLSAKDLRRYPPPTADALRTAIAERHGLDMNQVVITNGGDEALRLALTTFVEPGAALCIADPSYSLYPTLAAVHDAAVERIALDNNWQLPSDFAQRANLAGAQLTCLVNPHAPSGILTSTESLAELAAKLQGVLLIDEAYVDFVNPEENHDCIPLIHAYENVLILRTFSKGYGLAGMRLGYLLGSAGLIDPIIRKTRDSYNIDFVSQQIGLVAFNDLSYAQSTWTAVRQQRAIVRDALAKIGLPSPPSQSNFLLVTVPASAKRTAPYIYEHLKARGILVRFFDALPDKLRITIGTPEENQRLLTALSEVLT